MQSEDREELEELETRYQESLASRGKRESSPSVGGAPLVTGAACLLVGLVLVVLARGTAGTILGLAVAGVGAGFLFILVRKNR